MEKILAFTERQQIAKDVVATMKDALSEDPSKRIGIFYLKIFSCICLLVVSLDNACIQYWLEVFCWPNVTHHGLLKSYCVVPENIHTHHTEGIGNFAVVGVIKAKLLQISKTKQKLQWARFWVFSATTEFVVSIIFIMVVKIMILFPRYLMSLLMLDWFKIFPSSDWGIFDWYSLSIYIK